MVEASCIIIFKMSYFVLMFDIMIICQMAARKLRKIFFLMLKVERQYKLSINFLLTFVTFLML
jgi:hypothetical protein